LLQRVAELLRGKRIFRRRRTDELTKALAVQAYQGGLSLRRASEVLRRPEMKVPFRSLQDQGFVLGRLRGHNWIASDFDGRFSLSGTSVLFHDSLVIAAWCFDSWERRSMHLGGNP